MKKVFSIAIIAIICLGLTGCMTNNNISKDFSAGQIGCKPENIQIIDEKATMSGMHTWIAQCKGVEYFCTYHYGDGAKCSEIKK